MAPKGLAFNPTAILRDSSSGLLADPPASLTPKGELKATALLNPEIGPGSIVSIVGGSVKGAFLVEKATYGGETHGPRWSVEIEGKAAK
jgi:hypothetical protein